MSGHTHSTQDWSQVVWDYKPISHDQEAHMIGMRHIIPYVYSPCCNQNCFWQGIIIFFTNMGVGGIIYEAIQKFI